jgi:hypothetical protein
VKKYLVVVRFFLVILRVWALLQEKTHCQEGECRVYCFFFVHSRLHSFNKKVYYHWHIHASNAVQHSILYLGVSDLPFDNEFRTYEGESFFSWAWYRYT